INGAGAAQVAELTEHLLTDAPQLPRLTYRKGAPDDSTGDMRSFNASLGTIPDYAGPPNDQKGVLLSDVRPGSGAQQGGMQRGDILVQLGDKSIEGVHDLMFVLNSAKPNQTVKAVVLREGKRVEMKVTFHERGGGGPNPHGPSTTGEPPKGDAPKGDAKPPHP
ncbi:MAG TPA: PDZ domain-containing protein, partial [Polyangiaceae bacterium]|nr:PDZ domain-containing protein [Polyangiaceae bacterium]